MTDPCQPNFDSELEDGLSARHRQGTKRRRLHIRLSDDENSDPIRLTASLPHGGDDDTVEAPALELGGEATIATPRSSAAAAALVELWNPPTRPVETLISAPCRLGLPSRNDYLAAKVKDWRAAVKRDRGRELTERPLSPVPELAISSLEQRAEYFTSLVEKQMAYHGLLPKWQLLFNDAVTIAGECDFSTKSLVFSRNLLYANPGEMREVLLHEVAHALCGSRAGHNGMWRDAALSIGCSGSRCHTLTLAEAPWVLYCPRGCFESARFKRSYLARGCLCRVCGTACAYRRRAESVNTTTSKPADFVSNAAVEAQEDFSAVVRRCSGFLPADAISW